MRPWLELLKLRITIASTVTTVVGYVLFRGGFDWPLLPAALGILVQACGAAALNQVQEAGIDARMPRTARRPIPAGRIPRLSAGLYAGALLVAGTALVSVVDTTAALLGLAAAAIYNGIYTPLKRVTPFAALPGALIGALPPVAGWAAAGGPLNDPAIHLVAFFFFLWQIPHFWLLLLHYERDYALGGLPSLFDRFDRGQVARVTFLWIAAVAVATLLLPLYSVFHRPAPAFILAAAGLLVVVRALALLRTQGVSSPAAVAAAGSGTVGPEAAGFGRSCKLRFMEINTLALLVSVLLVTDRIL